MKLAEHFPSNHEQATKQQIMEGWQKNLREIIDQLLQKNLITSNVYQKTLDSITAWLHHPDHGADHSHNVYEGMRYIAGQDHQDVWVAENDSVLQAAAVLHDIMQLMPFVNPKNGEPLEGNQRVLHADLAANAVILFGRALGMSRRDIRVLQKSVRDHDLGYFNQVSENLPYVGQLLSDADKLYGAGFGDPTALVEQAIARNQLGSFHKEGWYLLREMSDEERANWQYGDRWNCDGISAVLKDMIGMPFYTAHGREIFEKRKQAFVEQAAELYAKRYDETMDLITQWSQQNSNEVQLTGKDQTPETVPCATMAELAQLTQLAYQRELDLPKKYRRLEFSPRGWMIQLPIGERLITIDPSVARFAFEGTVFQPEVGRENFKKQINRVIEEYQVSQNSDVDNY